VLRVVN